MTNNCTSSMSGKLIKFLLAVQGLIFEFETLTRFMWPRELAVGFCLVTAEAKNLTDVAVHYFR